MLTPKYARVAERLRQLIDEVEALPMTGDGHRYCPDSKKYSAWTVKVKNVVSSSFGRESAYFTQVDLFITPATMITQSTGPWAFLEPGTK